MAARLAAEGEVDVVFIEEHPVPGKPVYCAEGLSIGGIRDGGLEPTDNIVKQQITCARVFAPSGESIELTSDEWKGYVLDREIFDKNLADNAVNAGAELVTNTLCTGAIRENGMIVGVRVEKGRKPLEYRGKIVIGADGHWSIVRRSAGLKRYFDDYVSCAQYKLDGIDFEDPSVNEFWMGRKYAPGGYAWVFPKSENVANVGLGVRNIHEKPAIEYLKDFIENDPRFQNARVVRISGGICPVSGTLDTIVDNGLMLVGDAAGQLIPMTGAGIHSGIEAGKMAGRVAAKAVKEKDVSAERLWEYRSQFDEYWGKRISESRRVLNMLDKFSDEDLTLLAQVVTNEDILALANGENVAGTIAGIMRRSPRKIIRLIKAYLR
jgi:digeranylgeranylglycerophospholipid reductase